MPSGSLTTRHVLGLLLGVLLVGACASSSAQRKLSNSDGRAVRVEVPSSERCELMARLKTPSTLGQARR